MGGRNGGERWWLQQVNLALYSPSLIPHLTFVWLETVGPGPAHTRTQYQSHNREKKGKGTHLPALSTLSRCFSSTVLDRGGGLVLQQKRDNVGWGQPGRRERKGASMTHTGLEPDKAFTKQVEFHHPLLFCFFHSTFQLPILHSAYVYA